MNVKTEGLHIKDILFVLRVNYRELFGLFILIFFVAILYLSLATPMYRTNMVLAPASNDEEVGSRGGLSQLISGLGGKGGLDSNFFLFQQILYSNKLASELAQNNEIMKIFFKKYWNQKSKTWKPIQGIKGKIENIFGLYQEHFPSGQTVQEILNRDLVVKETKGGGYISVSFQHKDRDFLVNVLNEIYSTAERLIKEEAIVKQSYIVSFLRKELLGAEISEQKRALTQLLAEEGKKLILLNSELPYAAKIIDPAIIPLNVASPNVFKVIFFTFFTFLILSTLFLSVRINKLKQIST